MLICFDIDGTLADNSHRVNYVRSKPKNWAAFDAGIINDKPIEQIVTIAKMMAFAGHTVILCSGRGEETRKATEDWLYDNNIMFEELYMRKANDYRPDDVIKKELLDQIVIDFGKKPDMWFDDRPRVVKVIRGQGVFVIDCYQGTEDF